MRSKCLDIALCSTVKLRLHLQPFHFLAYSVTANPVSVAHLACPASFCSRESSFLLRPFILSSSPSSLLRCSLSVSPSPERPKLRAPSLSEQNPSSLGFPPLSVPTSSIALFQPNSIPFSRSCLHVKPSSSCLQLCLLLLNSPTLLEAGETTAAKETEEISKKTEIRRLIEERRSTPKEEKQRLKEVSKCIKMHQRQKN